MIAEIEAIKLEALVKRQKKMDFRKVKSLLKEIYNAEPKALNLSSNGASEWSVKGHHIFICPKGNVTLGAF